MQVIFQLSKMSFVVLDPVAQWHFTTITTPEEQIIV